MMPPTGHQEMGAAARLLCSPVILQRPMTTASSPSRPPGFAGAPSHLDLLNPLFATTGESVLGTPPMSSPPGRPARRRKTLAGMAINKARACTFSLRRASTRVKARRHAAPVAQKAEALLCRTMGIVKDGELVTAQVLEEFACRFRGQIPDMALAAFRALFKLDDGAVLAADEALVAQGGVAALDVLAPEAEASA
nr:uncharacterized protein LOC127329822 [Lolium perenne]